MLPRCFAAAASLLLPARRARASAPRARSRRAALPNCDNENRQKIPA